MYTLDTPTFRRVMNTGFEAAFCTNPLPSLLIPKETTQLTLPELVAYRATLPYLLSLGTPATWTLVTGGTGESGLAGVTATSQGALFSLAAVAARELAASNVRFNEVFLNYRVDYDLVCDEKPTMGPNGPKRMRASEFARVYERILADEGIKGGRVTVDGFQDLGDVKWRAKI